MTNNFPDSFKNALGRLSKEVREESVGEESKTLKKVLTELEFNSFDSIEGELISEGGMKKVYRITDSASKRSVAKAVLKYPDSDTNVLLRFIHEARITAMLEHPNIVPVYQVNHSEGEPYFIMKELKGETFSEVLKNCVNQDLTSLLNIFLKVCDAIAYAHSKRIVHLDLKPDNIHVGEFGEVLVMDWGLAKDLDKNDTIEKVIDTSNDPLSTLDGQIKGTIGYMSPEQARAENNRKNEKSDIYALGAILYHILEGDAPYDNSAPKKTLQKIARGEIKPLKADAPDALAAIVNKALSLNQKDRYSSVLDLSEDLKRYLSGFAPHAEGAPGWKKLMLFIGRHKRPFIVAASFSVLLILITVLFILSLKGKERIANENAAEARKNELLAIQNQRKSNELYKDLLDSVSKNSELVDMSLPLALRQSANFMYSTRFTAARNLLYKVYSEDINNAEYWYRLGQLHIGDFQFEKGVDYLKKCLNLSMDPMMETRVKIMIKVFDGVQLQKGDVEAYMNFVHRTKSLYHMPQLIVQIYSNIYNRWGLSTDRKVKVMQKSLEAMNYGPLKYTLKKVPGGFDLDFKNCKNLSNVTPLAGFPVVRLSLENCRKIEDMKWLRGGRIKYLNISNTKSSDYRFLHFMDDLEELVMSDIIMHSVAFRRVKVQKLNMSGAVINLADLYNPMMKELNLCSAKVSNIEQLKNYRSLNRLILPPVKIDKELMKTLNGYNLQIKKCDCNNSKKCTFSDF